MEIVSRSPGQQHPVSTVMNAVALVLSEHYSLSAATSTAVMAAPSPHQGLSEPRRRPALSASHWCWRESRDEPRRHSLTMGAVSQQRAGRHVSAVPHPQVTRAGSRTSHRSRAPLTRKGGATPRSVLQIAPDVQAFLRGRQEATERCPANSLVHRNQTLVWRVWMVAMLCVND